MAGLQISDLNLSIIVPTYNRCILLKQCIESITKASIFVDCGIMFELLVSDDGSSDDTELLVASYTLSYPWIRYVKLSHVGVSNARHQAVLESKYNYLIFTDSDCVVDALWLSNITHCILKNMFPDVIQGSYDKPVYQDWISKSEAAIDSKRWKGQEHDCRNLVIKRSTYDKIGGFSTNKAPDVFAEDLTLPVKLEKIDSKALFEKSIIVAHHYPNTVLGNIRRYYNYGLTAGYIKRNFPKLYRSKYSFWIKGARLCRRMVNGDNSPIEVLYQTIKLLSFASGLLMDQKNLTTQK